MKRTFAIMLILMALVAVSCNAATLFPEPTKAPLDTPTPTCAPTATLDFMIVTVKMQDLV